MGCCLSFSKRRKSSFGINGLHVGRDGDVDLTNRSMGVFEPKYVRMIQSDKLHAARRLHLSHNKLYTLGREMTLLPDIEELYIDANQFERLPTVLADLPNLRFLNASQNPLGRQQRALDVLPRMIDLTHLVLSDCSLSAISPCLLQCSLLKELDLSCNALQLDGVSFVELQALRTLRIANCGIQGEIPRGIKEMRTLETLDISGNSFNFEDQDFFGSYLTESLTTLHLRAMSLTGVPSVVIALRKLTFLDLAENALETLAVLAGRLVRKVSHLQRGSQFNPNSALMNESNNDAVSPVSHSTARASVHQFSRAGCIANVGKPVPLRKLSLRACGFEKLPKYFHKLTSLVDLDISENQHLDDPNMSLIAFSNLEVLNIVGCPFVENQRPTRNEWFDIANLQKLHTINWEVWKVAHNISPYRTKVPLEICGLRLQEINGVEVRPGLLMGDTVQTIINLMLDGYYKVDLALSDDLVYSYDEAVRLLNPLGSFFFRNLTNDGKRNDDSDAKKDQNKGDKTVGLKVATLKDDARLDVLQIVVNRYIFFLAMQAANYNTAIVPPADVMAIHYAQLTQDPVGYRDDCEAVCGQILDCNYSLFFLERRLRPRAAQDTVEESKEVWNKMVRISEKNLDWLDYNFWERSVKHRSPINAPTPATEAEAEATTAVGLPGAPACGDVIFSGLQGVNSVEDLCAVLDISITAHFVAQGVGRFAQSLRRFFATSQRFLDRREALLSHHFDWTPYVKYLALYATIQRIKRPKEYEDAVFRQQQQQQSFLLNNSFVSPDAYLPRPVERETVMPTAPRRKSLLLNRAGNSVDAHGERNGSSASVSVTPARSETSKSAWSGNAGGDRRRSQQLPTLEPVPTTGILLLLHTHRIAHAKYYQALTLLGIEKIDIEWDETSASLHATMQSWEALYRERYVMDPNEAFVLDDRSNVLPQLTGKETMEKSCVPSALRHGGVRRNSRLNQRVTFCCVSSEHAVL